MVNPKPKNRVKTSSKQPKTVTVTVSKTTQVPQFEPLVVTVSQTFEVEAGESARDIRDEALHLMGLSVKRAIIEQTELYLTRIGANKKRNRED